MTNQIPTVIIDTEPQSIELLKFSFSLILKVFISLKFFSFKFS